MDMATQVQVNNYIGYIRQALGNYGDRLATMNQQGNKPDFPKEIKFMLLQAYVDIAERYLEEWDSSIDDNFFTISEFEEIQQHINSICNSTYWLDLN